eukprot:1133652-Pelagomonas_calceolata.AAC.2
MQHQQGKLAEARAKLAAMEAATAAGAALVRNTALAAAGRGAAGRAAVMISEEWKGMVKSQGVWRAWWEQVNMFNSSGLQFSVIQTYLNV